LPAACAIGDVFSKTTATRGVYFCDPASTWTQLAAGGAGAPTGGPYLTFTTDVTLTAEQNLGALTTALLLNTVAAGSATLSAYAGIDCTNQFVRDVSAAGVGTCASVANADLAGSIAASKLVGTDIAIVGTITAGVWTGTDVALANIAAAAAASRLMGRGSAAGAGDFQELTIGAGLTISGTELSATGGGGSVATDVIWDAAGDLAVGSGANTAVRLARGTALQILQVNAGGTDVEWGAVSGTGSVARTTAPTITDGILRPTVTAVKTTSATIANAEEAVPCDPTAADITLTLPAASGKRGQTHYIYRVPGIVTNACIIDGNAAETVGGAATQTLYGDSETMTVRVNNAGTGWDIIQATPPNLGDPTADRVGGWDESAGTIGKAIWFSLGASLVTNGTVIERAALTGDVTAAQNGNATTIAADAVTYAKLQNVSATSRFLGRITGGAGDPEELTGANALTVIGTIPVASGGTNLTAAADDNVMVGNATTWETKALPNCVDSGGNHLNYTAATNAFSCGTTSSGGATLPAVDTTSIVEGSADATKEIRFEVDGLTTATVRVITAPDSNTTLPIIAQVVTLAGPTAARTYTFPDASTTVLTTNAAVTTAQGGTGLTAAADENVLVGNGTVWETKTLPNCVDSGGNHLNYTAATNAFSCGTTSSGGATLPAVDTTSIVEGSADATKEIRFEVDGLTTATVRVITAPDANTTLPIISQIVTVAGPTAARTYTFPDAASTIVARDSVDTLTNKALDVEGPGNSITTVSAYAFMTAACQGATASLGLSYKTGLGPTPTCITGTNVTRAWGTFPDSDGEFEGVAEIPLTTDFTGTMDVRGKWRAAATSGDLVIQVQWACTADAEVLNDTWSTASTTTDTAKATTLQANDWAVTGVSVTGCAAGENMSVRVMRQRTHASDTLTGTFDLGPFNVYLRRTQ
jgi:hypothetical protein